MDLAYEIIKLGSQMLTSNFKTLHIVELAMSFARISQL